MQKKNNFHTVFMAKFSIFIVDEAYLPTFYLFLLSFNSSYLKSSYMLRLQFL